MKTAPVGQVADMWGEIEQRTKIQKPAGICISSVLEQAHMASSPHDLLRFKQQRHPGGWAIEPRFGNLARLRD